MNAPASLPRYSVTSNGRPHQFMVFDTWQKVPFAGPESWEKANDLADHMNASSRLSRQQNEAEGELEDIPNRDRSHLVSSVGDWQWRAR